ncbi:MAG: sugar phosphate nucleotidyltransferase [Rhizobiaceae bacterium]
MAPAGDEVSITPVVMAGGRGARLWPLSRQDHPKQYLRPNDGLSLLAATWQRLNGLAMDGEIIVATSQGEESKARAELNPLPGVRLRLFLEPEGRNTAATIAAITHLIASEDAGRMLAFLPSDHDVSDAAAFRACLSKAARSVATGGIALIGVKPDTVQTGYGHVLTGKLEGLSHPVLSFVEKPDSTTAAELSKDHGLFWNAGIFVGRADSFRDALARHAPVIMEQSARAVEASAKGSDWVSADRALFAGIQARPFDKAVMEQFQGARLVAADFGWNDLGTWRNYASARGGGASGGGAILANGASNITLHAGRRLVAVSGVSDLTIVDTPDALLITSSDAAGVHAIHKLVEETSPRHLRQRDDAAGTLAMGEANRRRAAALLEQIEKQTRLSTENLSETAQGGSFAETLATFTFEADGEEMALETKFFGPGATREADEAGDQGALWAYAAAVVWARPDAALRHSVALRVMEAELAPDPLEHADIATLRNRAMALAGLVAGGSDRLRTTAELAVSRWLEALTGAVAAEVIDSLERRHTLAALRNYLSLLPGGTA